MITATKSADTTIWDQISTSTKMACGARVAMADGNAYLHFQVGSSRPVRKIIIRLNGLDLYDIELVKINNRTFETAVEQTISSVYAEDLSNVIYHMVNR